MRRPRLTALAVAICTLSGVAAYVGARPAVAGWREIAWPFPRDGWPAGRAFRCDAALCGERGRTLCAAEDRILQLRLRRHR